MNDSSFRAITINVFTKDRISLLEQIPTWEITWRRSQSFIPRNVAIKPLGQEDIINMSERLHLCQWRMDATARYSSLWNGNPAGYVLDRILCSEVIVSVAFFAV